MSKVLEQQLKKCSSCKRKTTHLRNNSKSSGFMVMVHLILTICSVGLWLLIIVPWKVLNTKIGGWSCSECR